MIKTVFIFVFVCTPVTARRQARGFAVAVDSLASVGPSVLSAVLGQPFGCARGVLAMCSICVFLFSTPKNEMINEIVIEANRYEVESGRRRGAAAADGGGIDHVRKPANLEP
jgi:hypothetical protein